jgi:hypothetical protein
MGFLRQNQIFEEEFALISRICFQLLLDKYPKSVLKDYFEK